MLITALMSLLAVQSAGIPSPSTSDPIVVQADRDRHEQIERFVKALTPAPIRGQLPKFRDSFCPQVIGLSKRQDRLVQDRIRAIALAAGIPVAKEGCDPNGLLILTDDKRALIRDLDRTTPDFFPVDWGPDDVSRVENDPSPVVAWQLEVITGADGVDLGQASFSGDSSGANPRFVLVQRIYGSSSRLRAMTTHRFGGTVAIVEARALEGLSTTQLADYAAMRLLVRTDPRKYQTLGDQTILNVVDAPMGSDVPLTLTRWDLDFLKAFYRAPADAYAESQRSAVVRQMERSQ